MKKKYKLCKKPTIKKGIATLYKVKYRKTYEPQGYIESKHNLSKKGSCVVLEKAEVFGHAKVKDNAIIAGSAKICKHANVEGNAKVSGASVVSGNSVVTDDTYITDSAIIHDNARVSGKAIVRDLGTVLDHAVIKDNAVICSCGVVSGYTIIGKDGYIASINDYITIKGLGSANRYTTFYRTKDLKVIRVICGCFEGTLEEFESKVKETHKDTRYEKEYLSIIETAKIHFELDQ